MGTDYYFMISYSEGHAFDNRQVNAIGIVEKELEGFFHDYFLVKVETEPAQRTIYGYYKNSGWTDSLIPLIQSLPWLRPETVQVFVKSEHIDKYNELTFETPEGYRPGSVWAGSGDVDLLNSLTNVNP